MIVTVGNTKGGVGKTTLAVNLVIALARRRLAVLLIDGDEQGTALAFTQLRADRLEGACGYTAIALHGANIRSQLWLHVGLYDHIVIDVGGRDSGSLRAALTVSDLLLIPTAPRSFDLWGVDQTAELVSNVRDINPNLRALAVVNLADFQGRDNRDAAAMLADVDGVEVLRARLVRRKVYPNAAAQGLSILEVAGASKACAEFRQLVNALFPKRRNNDCQKAQARKRN